MSDDDLPSSPPSLTHSPDNRHVAVAATKTKGRNIKANPPPAMMATAELQALLPRRRTRRPTGVRTERDIFEIESAEEEEEDENADELSMIAPRRGTHIPAPAPRDKQITKLKAAAALKGKRSYGKKAVVEEDDPANDQENGGEDEHDDSLAPIDDSIEDGESSILEGRVGKELKKAKKKFMDVDKWEMEFESVTAEGSSQADAR